MEMEYYLSEMNGVKMHYWDVHVTEELQDNGMDILAHKLAEHQPLMIVPIPFASVCTIQLAKVVLTFRGMHLPLS